MTITAAADGSALGNPGPAGWGWYVDEDRWAAGGWPHGTNNQGELTAVLDLLQQTEHTGEDLLIYCDSRYVINSITQWMAGWKRRGWRKGDGKPVLNLEIMQALDEAMARARSAGRSIRFEWVKGHAGHVLNEQADRLANGAAAAYQAGRVPDPGPGIPGARVSGGERAPGEARPAGSSNSGNGRAAEGAPLDAGRQPGLFDAPADSTRNDDTPNDNTSAQGAAQAWGGPLWAAADLITPMAVRVAATLRVADAIAEGITTARRLADRVDVQADPLRRVLDHLVTAGFLARLPDGSYALTDAGQWLREDHPEGIRAWVDLEGALGHADLSAVELLHTVRTGQAAFPRRYGLDFWQDLAENPVRAASFDTAMGHQAVDEAPLVAGAYDWAALGTVVDVGGGDASLLIALLRAHPTLRGTVLDLAGPADAAVRNLAAAGLADRSGAVAGSMFDPLPPGAGGYILSRVLHDWDDEDASRILQRCAQAAGDQGRVLVIEESRSPREINTEMDLRMLLYVCGRERSLDELAALGRSSGLSVTHVTDVSRFRTLIEFVPGLDASTGR